MRIRGVVAALALGCGAPPAASPEPDVCDVGRRTLLVTHDPLAYDATTEVHVEGAEPGQMVSLWWSAVEDAGCTCPDPDGPCFELEAPELLGTVQADASGRGTIEVTLPADQPVETRWIQATTSDTLSARTPAVVSARMLSHYTGAEAHYLLRGDGIGRFVAAVGDVDGDGRTELAATAPSRGALHLFDVAAATRGDGEPAQLDDLPDRITLHGPIGPGARVAGVGDVDLDGRDDIVVSSPESGVVWLVPGGLPPGDHDLDAVALRRLLGPGVGTDIAGTDTDGDGRTDLVVGSPANVMVSKGADLHIDQWVKGPLNARFTAVGDLDADERGDLLVTGDDGVFIFYGPTVLVQLDPTPGVVVGPAGDLNDDGFGDALLAEPGWDGGRGRIRVVNGPTSPIDDPKAVVLQGVDVDERLGLAVAGAGDLDGDGMGELVATRADGSVVLLFGPAQGYEGSDGASVRFDPAETGWRFVALAGPGVDADADGVHDLVLGSVSPDGERGGVHVFRGAPGW